MLPALFSVMLGYVMFTLLSDNIRQNLESKDNNMTNDDLVYSAIKSHSSTLIALISTISLILVLLTFVFNVSTLFMCISLLISIVVGLIIGVIFYIIGPWVIDNFKYIAKLLDKEISKYPSIVKDLALVVTKDKTSEEIINAIKKSGGRLLTNIEVFDVYVGDKIASDEKSIAYSLTFNDPSRTLTEEEVMNVFNKIITDVEKSNLGKLRDN